jgi:hypothetical protein
MENEKEKKQRRNKIAIAISLGIAVIITINIVIILNIKMSYENKYVKDTKETQQLFVSRESINKNYDKKSNTTTTENVNKMINLSTRNITFTDEDKKLILTYLTRYLDYDLKMLDQYDQKIKELNDQKLRSLSDKEYIGIVDGMKSDLESKRSQLLMDYEYHQNNFLSFYNAIK